MRLPTGIVKDMDKPFQIGGQEIISHASIGIVYNTEIGDAQSILRDADIAMYRAKVLGKNRYEIFEERLREDTISRVRLESELRKAIQDGQFFLEYQPIFSLGGNEALGVEALVRWRHPSQGVVSPYYFIPIAEETGLIIQIGEWVLREACQQMVEWQRSFHFRNPLQINVNLSARQMILADLKDTILEVLRETGLPPECLVLEITETTIMDNIDLASELLEELHQVGVQFHVDDFGVGHSSLYRLQELPIQALKIDRSFVKDASRPGGNIGILRAIAMMGREMHLATIAEGIENEGQLKMLQKLKCDAGQGYFLSKPKSSTDIEMLLEQLSGISSVISR